MKSILHTATISAQVAIVGLLLKHGVEADSRDGKGRTAMHIAILGSNITMIEYLQSKVNEAFSFFLLFLFDHHHTPWLQLYSFNC